MSNSDNGGLQAGRLFNTKAEGYGRDARATTVGDDSSIDSLDSNSDTAAVMATNTTAAVELRGLTKHFGSVLANAGVDLRVEPGTIHGVIGENGAGKSTAMKMLYGIFP